MTRTTEEVEQALAETEAMLEGTTFEDLQPTPDLAAIGELSLGIEEATERLRAAVAAARANGRSWGLIGMALGVSKQAARERFGEKVPPTGGKGGRSSAKSGGFVRSSATSGKVKTSTTKASKSGRAPTTGGKA